MTIQLEACQNCCDQEQPPRRAVDYGTGSGGHNVGNDSGGHRGYIGSDEKLVLVTKVRATYAVDSSESIVITLNANSL